MMVQIFLNRASAVGALKVDAVGTVEAAAGGAIEADPAVLCSGSSWGQCGGSLWQTSFKDDQVFFLPLMLLWRLHSVLCQWAYDSCNNTSLLQNSDDLMI